MATLQDLMNDYFDTEMLDGKPRVSSTPCLYDIAKGNVSGSTALHKFGRNPTVGTTEEPVWTTSTAYSYLSAGEKLKVSSDDVNDDGDPASTGARTIILEGLDDSYEALSETVIMDGAGTNSVETIGTYLRIFRAYVATAGSTGANEGTISIENNASTITLADIAPGMNQTEMAMWTVPSGKTFYMIKVWASESSAQSTILKMFVRPNGGVFQNRFTFVLNGSVLDRAYELPIAFSAESDIEIRAVTSAGGGIVAAGFDGWYE